VVIGKDVIRNGYPNCPDPAAWAAALTAAFARFPEFNALGAACIIGKAEMETGGLTQLDEGMRYSPQRMLEVFGQRAVRTDAAKAAVAAHVKNTPWPAIALNEAAEVAGDEVATGDRVYAALGGFAARGGGLIQLTGLANQTAFAQDMGKTLAEGRDYIRTVPGAAMTGPWYIAHVGGTAAANGGNMKEILRLVAGKRTMAELDQIWGVIHGDKQLAAFQRFKELLGA
jgi:predicted chitinase